MAIVHPYLNFNGNAAEAFDFYKSVFGGEFAMVMRFKDVPSEVKMDESEGDKIMHMSLPLGGGTMIMGSDVPQVYGTVTLGSAFNISISAESEEEAKRVYNALSEGGAKTMPLDKAFWGSLFGMLTDKFGVQWMVSFDYNRQQ